MRIEFSTKSKKFLKKSEKEIRKRIIDKIELLIKESFPPDAKRIINQKGKIFRIRVGNYRILYEVFSNENLILIVDINKRSKIYK